MPEWLRYVVEGFLTILVPLLIWIARLLLDIRQDVRDFKVTIFGVQGDNGINGDVKLLKAEKAALEIGIREHAIRIEDLEERLGRPAS